MVSPLGQPHFSLSNLKVSESGILSFKAANTVFRIKIISDSNHKLTKDEQRKITQICGQYFSNIDLSSIKSCKIIENNGDLKITVNEETVEYGESVKNSKGLLKSKFQPYLNFFMSFFDKDEPSFLKIESDLYEALSELNPKTQKALLRNLENITPKEQEFFNFLKENIAFEEGKKNETILQILSGAYVIIDDGGKTYDKWKEGAKKRISSHEANATQYSFQGPVLKEWLFSTKERGKKTVTWFQLERYTAQDIIRHSWTYILYKLSEENQGPYGSSAYRERSEKQIILRLKEM